MDLNGFEAPIGVAIGVYLLRETIRGVNNLRQSLNGGSAEKQSVKLLSQLVHEQRETNRRFGAFSEHMRREHEQQARRLEGLGSDVKIIKDRGDRG